MKTIARIFEEVTGKYHVCDKDGPLDTSGKAYNTKADAIRGASRSGYTHAVGSGTYWDGVKAIPGKYRE